MDIPHSFQIAPYGFLVYTIFDGKLLQCLLTLYIVRDNLWFISTNTAIKTAATILTFIPLSAASQAISDHIFRPTEKAFLKHINENPPYGFGGDEHELHYFNSKKQGELDFVIAQNGKVNPIEVKSGKDYERHNALTNVLANDDYNIDFAYVLTNDNLRVEGKRIYMPIYMLMFIQKSPAPANQIFIFDLHSL